ncbi:hypothetical protein BJ165DRAFT_1407746 [Panaeolus papilionaceus]|nr:hypothetical protein BJ165DRAFT_1407746 [Panaeolus papilionaceus]
MSNVEHHCHFLKSLKLGQLLIGDFDDMFIGNMCSSPEEAQSFPSGRHHLECAIIGIILGIIVIILCALLIHTVVVTVILPLVIFVMRVLLALGGACVRMIGEIFIIVLRLVGFGINGITPGSLAALWQSVYYGAVVPAGSVFATLTSCAMTPA